jgi:signal transduction histidine kinase
MPFSTSDDPIVSTSNPVPGVSDETDIGVLGSIPRAVVSSTAPARDHVRPSVSVSWQGDVRSQRFTYVGTQAVHLLGFPLAAWYEEGFWVTHLAPEERERVLQQRRESVARDADFESMYHMVASSGSPVLVREIATVTRLADNVQVLSGIFLASDEPFATGEMTESVKAFASFIGHELSQPIGAVLANAEAMQSFLRADPPRVADALEALADVAVGARHAASIIGAIRTTAR